MSLQTISTLLLLNLPRTTARKSTTTLDTTMMKTHLEFLAMVSLLEQLFESEMLCSSVIDPLTNCDASSQRLQAHDCCWLPTWIHSSLPARHHHFRRCQGNFFPLHDSHSSLIDSPTYRSTLSAFLSAHCKPGIRISSREKFATSSSSSSAAIDTLPIPTTAPEERFDSRWESVRSTSLRERPSSPLPVRTTIKLLTDGPVRLSLPPLPLPRLMCVTCCRGRIRIDIAQRSVGIVDEREISGASPHSTK